MKLDHAWFPLSLYFRNLVNDKVTCPAKELVVSLPPGFSASIEPSGSECPCRKRPIEMPTIFIMQFLDPFGDLILHLRSLWGVLLPYSRTRRYGCMRTLISTKKQIITLLIRTCFIFSAFYPLDGPIAQHLLKLR